MTPENGNLGDYSGSTKGANVTFRCNQDFVPVTEMVSVCSSDGVWDPAPEKHNCTAGMANMCIAILVLHISSIYKHTVVGGKSNASRHSLALELFPQSSHTVEPTIKDPPRNNKNRPKFEKPMNFLM